MMGKPITCRMWIPDGNDGYREWNKLTDEEKDAFAEKCAQRIGKAVNNYYSQHNGEIAKFMEELRNC